MNFDEFLKKIGKDNVKINISSRNKQIIKKIYDKYKIKDSVKNSDKDKKLISSIKEAIEYENNIPHTRRYYTKLNSYKKQLVNTIKHIEKKLEETNSKGEEYEHFRIKGNTKKFLKTAISRGLQESIMTGLTEAIVNDETSSISRDDVEDQHSSLSEFLEEVDNCIEKIKQCNPLLTIFFDETKVVKENNLKKEEIKGLISEIKNDIINTWESEIKLICTTFKTLETERTLTKCFRGTTKTIASVANWFGASLFAFIVGKKIL